MVPKTQLSSQISAAIASFMVLLCFVEFIRVEMILKTHVTRIRNIELSLTQRSKAADEPYDASVGNGRKRSRRETGTTLNTHYRKLLSYLEDIQNADPSANKCATKTNKKCLAGPPGRQGKRGRAGLRGKQGRKGDTGMQGLVGRKGDSGTHGVKGDTGMQGLVGRKGISGKSGVKGGKGDRGFPGQSVHAPEVIISPPSLVVNESQRAVLQCSSSGFPKPAIAWKKVRGFSASNSSQLTSADGLVFPKVTPRDSGLYQCQATNFLGAVKQTVQLTVNFRPRLLMDSSPLFLKEGDNITLPTCRVRGIPVPKVIWSRASLQLPKARIINQREQLFILKLKKQDSDVYFCRAENSLGSAVGRVQLSVFEFKFIVRPPRTVETIVGYSFALNCSAKGDLKPRILWTKKRGKMPPARRSERREGTLKVKGVRKEDSGVYVCSASSAGIFNIEAATRVIVKTAADCAQIYKSGERQSGIYTVDPDGYGDVQVYCDMKTDGGGWTVFQRRSNGSVDFYRNWHQYKKGFGKLTGEFWLGNDKIHRLTLRATSTLRVELEDWNGVKAFAKYGTFQVGSESLNYRLSVGLFTGSAGDSLSWHNSMDFTTKDRDNDRRAGRNCAIEFIGAWWYNACHSSNLNGKYFGKVSDNRGVKWQHFRGKLSLKSTEMKLRLNTF